MLRLWNIVSNEDKTPEGLYILAETRDEALRKFASDVPEEYMNHCMVEPGDGVEVDIRVRSLKKAVFDRSKAVHDSVRCKQRPVALRNFKEETLKNLMNSIRRYESERTEDI